jgi:hypothetical protein
MVANPRNLQQMIAALSITRPPYHQQAQRLQFKEKQLRVFSSVSVLANLPILNVHLSSNRQGILCINVSNLNTLFKTYSVGNKLYAFTALKLKSLDDICNGVFLVIT